MNIYSLYLIAGMHCSELKAIQRVAMKSMKGMNAMYYEF